MRVPVYESDLLRNGAFKKSAKRINGGWPAADRPGLMEAQEILARSLGYQCSHDLQRSVLPNHLDAPAFCTFLSESEVRSRIQGSIVAHPTCTHVSLADVDRLVASLPLQRLQTYILGHSGQLVHKAEAVHQIASTSKMRPRNRLPISDYMASKRILTLEELAKLQETVNKRGFLRDQCVLGMLFQGLRASEILAARAASPIEVVMIKARHQRHVNMSLSKALVNSLTQFIRQEGIPPGNYILRNARGNGRASMVTLSKIFQGIVKASGIEGPIRMPVVRRSVQFHLSQAVSCVPI